MSKLGQEPAFPIFSQYGNPARYDDIQVVGISKRFYAACAAMQGLISNGTENKYEKDLTIMRAFEYADELLKQETL